MRGDSIIFKSDSYKASHYRQYPPDTEEVYSYFESRGGEFSETVFFGLQAILQKHLTRDVTRNDVDEAREFFAQHFGDPTLFNEFGWLHIVKDHQGRLPLEIKAVAEGTVVTTGNVLMTVRNTCPQCFWLTNYLETILSQVWYPSTVATLSRKFRKTILGFLEKSGTPELIDFKLHDFGYRGASSEESAGIAAAAHLLSFSGTDTLAGIRHLYDHYYADKMMGFSVPAAEHSTITSWGRSHEVDAYLNMLRAYPRSPIVAVVSDSYDVYNACEHLWGEMLKSEVMAHPGILVVRPDSGHPPTVVLKCLEILGAKFGYEINSKGYKVLNKVRVLQGDGINLNMTVDIMVAAMAKDWSADNIGFGCGGGLHQKVDRDTCRCAFKCSCVNVGGFERDVFKAPSTDSGKASKKGKLSLVFGASGYRTIETRQIGPNEADLLELAFLNGEVLTRQTYTDIKSRVLAYT